MSRFYKIAIHQKDLATGESKLFIPPCMEPWRSRLTTEKLSFTSVLGGQNLTSALNVALHIPLVSGTNVGQGANLRVYGVGLEDISSFTYLFNTSIQVWGGMNAQGLPLSEHPAGTDDLLMHGTIWSSSGFWEDTNMALDFGFLPNSPTDNTALDETVDLTLEWKLGEPLAPALKKMLEQAYGQHPDANGKPTRPDGYEIVVQISDQLVYQGSSPAAITAPFATYGTMAQKLGEITREIMRTAAAPPPVPTVSSATSTPPAPRQPVPRGAEYMGVLFTVWNKKLIAYDNTKDVGVPGMRRTKEDIKVIKFRDLIGQPTWKTWNEINFKTTMRADIQIGSYVRLPDFLGSPYVGSVPSGNSPPNTAAGGRLPARNSLAFYGEFRIMEIHHMGDFRQADARSWVTVYDAVYVGNMNPENVRKLFPFTGGGGASP